MKKILYIIAAIAALTFSASCSQERLEIPQKGVIDYDDFYNGSTESALSAATSCYQAAGMVLTLGAGFSIGIQNWCIAKSYYVLSNAPSDDSYYGSGYPTDHVFGIEINEYRPSFNGNSTVIRHVYSSCYMLIHDCNLLTDNYEYGSDELINRSLSEARFFRAWAHFILATYWGTPPKVDHLLTGAERPENSNHEELMAWCAQELEDCAKYLPSKSGLNDKANAVRVTKEAALAMAGKVHVYAGNYEKAKTDLKAVIDSKKYDLVSGERMSELFHRQEDACEEKVLELNYIDYPGGVSGFGGHSHGQANESCFWRDLKAFPSNIIQHVGWGGGGNPSQSFVDAIRANEGDSYRRKAWIISYDELIGDCDYSQIPELKGATKEEKLMSSLLGLKEDVPSYYANCGWFSLKYAPRYAELGENTETGTDQNNVIMRYAEVLLLYAEACAWSSDDGSGLAALNKVQTRAGAPTTSLTKENVKNEKRFELYLEGSRWADLVRWGDAATVLKDQYKSVPNFRDEFYENGKPSGKPHHAVPAPSDTYYNNVTEYGFKAGKNELMPFPHAELVINEALQQNPGWDR